MQKDKEYETIKYSSSSNTTSTPTTSPLCEKNKIKQSVMCCVYCGKSYKVRLNLEKHLILCEITHKAKRPISTSNSNTYNDDDESIQPNVSTKKLYQIVMQLSLKCNRLENKVADLSKYVTKKIQKIDVIDYLNNRTNSMNSSSTTTKLLFENITEIITVEQSDIEFLFHNSFMETVNLVLSRSIYNETGSSEFTLPIAAFTQKANIIYGYTKNQEQNICWSIVSREKFIRFLNIIQFKMSKALTEWRKKNFQLLNDSDGQCILYDKTFSKLMDPEFKIEKTYIKFYNNIYNKIKSSINL